MNCDQETYQKQLEYGREWKKKNRAKQNEYDRKWRKTLKGALSKKYQKARKSAKKRELEFSLTKEQYLNIIGDYKCFYCSGDFTLEIWGTSLDRINNDLGYTEDNVVPCCGNCNILRGKLLTKEETKKIIEFLAVLRNKSNPWK